MWAELEIIAPFSPGYERAPHQIPGSTTTSDGATVSAVILSNVMWIWRKLLRSQMGESDNLSCLMNASVHLKQVVTSDANVGRQLKFSMGELMIFAFSVHSQLHFNVFFSFHELDFSIITWRLLCCREPFSLSNLTIYTAKVQMVTRFLLHLKVESLEHVWMYTPDPTAQF